MRDLIQWIAGQHIAIMLCGHNQPDMSGDQRNRLSDMRRRQCDNAARAITDHLLDDELPIARALALLDRVGDAAADALIKGEAAVVPVEPTIEMVQASNPVDDAQDLLAHFTLHEGIAAGRLDKENDNA